MSSRERWFIIFVLFGTSALTLFDLFTDVEDGVSLLHAGVEGAVVVIAAAGVVYLLKGTFRLKRSLENQRELSDRLAQENKAYKEQSKKYVEGLSQSIDDQLSKWELSKAEKEVAFLLLKGFSLKEIAQLRGTTERTARTQSASVYAKAGLENRSQLAAFFLEDLLLPQEKYGI